MSRDPNPGGKVSGAWMSMIQAVVVAVISGVAGYFTAVAAHTQEKAPIRLENTNRILPVSDLMLFEQGSVEELRDADTPLYVICTNVRREESGRLVQIQLTYRKDRTQLKAVDLRQSDPQVAVLKTSDGHDRKYRIAFSRLGTFDRDPAQPQSRSVDFAILSIESCGP